MAEEKRVALSALIQYNNDYHSILCAPIVKPEQIAAMIVVAGLPGTGKTTWISQFLQDQHRPLFYCCPGIGACSVDQARITYRFPWVHLIPENQVLQVLADLPEQALVYFELGFHLDLASPVLGSLPCHRVAVLPPGLKESDWHEWADEVIPGNHIPVPDPLPELWRSPLTGQVFDPPSLDEMLRELTSGAYGNVHRVKGIFELPNGHAFYVDFAEGLSGIEYTKLPLPPWLEGRPTRFSGLEVMGWNLDQESIVQAVVDGCLSDAAIAQYQQHYKALVSDQTNPQESALT